MSLRSAIKSRVLPHGRHVRRLPLGIGRGLKMGVDFQRGETSLYFGLYEIELNRHLPTPASTWAGNMGTTLCFSQNSQVHTCSVLRWIPS